MFMISMPRSFKIGDTAQCRINKRPARISWRDADTLVIELMEGVEADDPRVIFSTVLDGDLRNFMCGNTGDRKGDAKVEHGYDNLGRMLTVVSRKKNPNQPDLFGSQP